MSDDPTTPTPRVFGAAEPKSSISSEDETPTNEKKKKGVAGTPGKEDHPSDAAITTSTSSDVVDEAHKVTIPEEETTEDESVVTADEGHHSLEQEEDGIEEEEDHPIRHLQEKTVDNVKMTYMVPKPLPTSGTDTTEEEPEPTAAAAPEEQNGQIRSRDRTPDEQIPAEEEEEWDDLNAFYECVPEFVSISSLLAWMLKSRTERFVARNAKRITLARHELESYEHLDTLATSILDKIAHKEEQNEPWTLQDIGMMNELKQELDAAFRDSNVNYAGWQAEMEALRKEMKCVDVNWEKQKKMVQDVLWGVAVVGIAGYVGTGWMGKRGWFKALVRR